MSIQVRASGRMKTVVAQCRHVDYVKRVVNVPQYDDQGEPLVDADGNHIMKQEEETHAYPCPWHNETWDDMATAEQAAATHTAENGHRTMVTLTNQQSFTPVEASK